MNTVIQLWLSNLSFIMCIILSSQSITIKKKMWRDKSENITKGKNINNNNNKSNNGDYTKN